MSIWQHSAKNITKPREVCGKYQLTNVLRCWLYMARDRLNVKELTWKVTLEVLFIYCPMRSCWLITIATPALADSGWYESTSITVTSSIPTPRCDHFGSSKVAVAALLRVILVHNNSCVIYSSCSDPLPYGGSVAYFNPFTGISCLLRQKWRLSSCTQAHIHIFYTYFFIIQTT